MSERILLVEDDPINIKFISTVLVKKGGYEVVVSEEVDEILRLARETDLKAVIMDVSLSRSSYEGRKVDGIFITQLLKQDAATRHIPVLLATAHAMFGDREKYLELTGAEGYIAKPIHDPASLIEAVKAVIGH
ncbi:response regulator [Geothrix oryzae]|jgi:CheY-like chemotaxis protein|uniref:Response regulator n=1 Tax=Geothrix oryzae TaxID=2927975 RepID=A0ABN6V518_9BACT|nr:MULTISPECIES: response regulator [Geothrix]BDU69335.1 response regulator [Geothrix oryzae]